MDTLQTVILGVIQGATEFLPVSSSGHLAAAQMLFATGESGAFSAAHPLLLEILLHLATLVAVVAYYRKWVIRAIAGAGRAAVALVRGQLRSQLAADEDANLAVAILAGTMVTGAIGYAMREPAAAVSRSSLGLGFTFVGCACLLYASRYWPGGNRRLPLKAALAIGAIQGIAVLPGISRSGVTIATALALGLEREEAARFSFLLSIPAIIGAAVLELDVDALVTGDQVSLTPYLLGALAAFAVGLAALYVLVRLVRRGRLWLFAPYVAGVGLCVIFLI